MTDLLQLVFAGLAQGAVYGLVALGFVAIFAVREIVNLVQGEYAALAGLAAISAVGAGLPLLVAIIVVVPLVVGVAVLIERITIAPIKKMTPLTSIILTLGVSTAVKALMLLIWGPEAKGLPNFPGSDIVLGGVSIRSQELWVLGIAAIVGYAVIWFYEHTVRGKSLRACAEQPIAARLVAIRERHGGRAFAFSSSANRVLAVSRGTSQRELPSPAVPTLDHTKAVAWWAEVIQLFFASRRTRSPSRVAVERGAQKCEREPCSENARVER